MKIAQSDIDFSTSHSFVQEDVTQESFRYWKDDSADENVQSIESDTLTLSAESLMRQFQRYSSSAESFSCCNDSVEELNPKLLSTQLILEALTGKKINTASFQPVGKELAQPPPLTNSQWLEKRDHLEQGFGWGMEYEYFNSHREEESLVFSATGSVITDDNRKIDLGYQLAMSRQFYQEVSVHFEAGDGAKKLIDPLVINFDNNGVGFGPFTLDFDLDGDGQVENISFVSPGSGFLAVDVNSDGIINDGTELFGPQTGNGFAELAQFDSDGNGWLDESDPLFDTLKIWMADNYGNLILSSAAEKNVGAIFLEGEHTDFTFTDEHNNSLAQLKKSSIALGENATTLFVGELDLVV